MSTRTSTVFALLSCIGILAVAIPALAAHKPAASIPASDLIQPADFAAALNQSKTLKPLILQVGFRNAYAQAHIPDAEYAGAAGDEDGLKTLQKRVVKLPTDTAIVIYCGCCPWSRCPNIAAAYEALHNLGFQNVKVLQLADDFGSDWVDKGYPTTKGT